MRGRSPEKQEAYSLEYVEDFSAEKRCRWLRIVAAVEWSCRQAPRQGLPAGASRACRAGGARLSPAPCARLRCRVRAARISSHTINSELVSLLLVGFQRPRARQGRATGHDLLRPESREVADPASQPGEHVRARSAFAIASAEDRMDPIDCKDWGRTRSTSSCCRARVSFTSAMRASPIRPSLIMGKERASAEGFRVSG